MGSGKSTVGRDLATRLARPHRDTDATVVDAAGVSVREIFERGGEAEFRLRESAALIDILSGPPAVVSTGGGIVVSASNRALLSDTGSFVVWLDAGVEVLVKRVRGGRGRPLLDGDVKGNLTTKVAEREAFYAEVADTRVDTTEIGRRAAVERILSVIRQEGDR